MHSIELEPNKRRSKSRIQLMPRRHEKGGKHAPIAIATAPDIAVIVTDILIHWYSKPIDNLDNPNNLDNPLSAVSIQPPGEPTKVKRHFYANNSPIAVYCPAGVQNKCQCQEIFD